MAYRDQYHMPLGYVALNSHSERIIARYHVVFFPEATTVRFVFIPKSYISLT